MNLIFIMWYEKFEKFEFIGKIVNTSFLVHFKIYFKVIHQIGQSNCKQLTPYQKHSSYLYNIIYKAYYSAYFNIF